MAMHSGSTTKTYLYLRVGLVGLAVFLGAALVLEIALGDGPWLDSISAYFYTPVRNVFVGTLCAMGVCLIALKGRDRPREDLMLNLAGMCAPLVALCPTPLDGRVPASYVPGVENGVGALLVVGALGVVFAAWTVRRGADAAGDLVALAASGGGVLAVGLWFALDRSSFLDYAHYAAAVLMFGLVVAVALVNAAQVEEFVAAGGTLTMGAATTFRRLYRAIASAMGVVLGGALVLGVVYLVSGAEPFAHWVFVVEALLLALFTAFWVLQTVQYAVDGAPQ
ncbi:hypothetical protein G5V58_23500 [Nocardioides anomalus]|uniref:DUF998 domain-containing protein n=1 Tax=Nocardioides anomalus TaxID=2712223 RepID=A0A6G6WJK7_9ACTN|nr:hypothetical protein [Nocardioides anomalus]QIG45323.1 hypothetical protein G5V58_23500 [Nocardioides anomalus]